MKTILCFGDSNTYGYNPETGLRYPKEIRYPGRLQALLGDGYTVIEEGCNGRTTICKEPGNEWKNGLDYLRPCLNSHKPVDIVIMMLGSNDLKKIYNLSAEEIAHGAGILCDIIKEFTKEKQGREAKIILVSPPEIGAGISSSPFSVSFNEDAIARSKEFPKYYKAVAEEKGCLFIDAAEYATPSEYDSLHLTPEGHKKLAEVFAEAVKQYED
ncbi:MAG: SGNH/GDSL hydrolase family protein [Clostridiales bacterium]|nr:SGNH/GDSL hydrolase family protein [Clostridiales bacterium]